MHPDRRRLRLDATPDRAPGAAAARRSAREYAAMHDWLAEEASASADCAEAELLVDWRRECDRSRHERPHTGAVRRDPAGHRQLESG